MRFISLFLVALLPLAACNESEKTCSSVEVTKILRSKLITGLNYTVGIENFYNGKSAKLELDDPHYVGQNNDYTLCSVKMRRIHYVNPTTGKRYPSPEIQESSIPYSFKALDKMTVFVKINQ